MTRGAASDIRLLIPLFAILLLAAPLDGEQSTDSRNPFFYRIEGLRRHFTWGCDFVPTGVDLVAGYRGFFVFPQLQTIVQANLGGGYEGFETYRDSDYTPNVQIPPEKAAGEALNLEFNSPNLQWQLGLRQGLLWNRVLERNLLEAFVFYRGRFDRYLNGRHFWCTEEPRIQEIEDYHEQWQQDYPGTDAYGIFGTSLLVGMAVDNMDRDTSSKAYNGAYAELSLEASPYLPSVMGASDFRRLNFSSKTFKTLYQALLRNGCNVFSVYLGSYFSIDYAAARRQMPLYVMQTFGGTELREGLADSVRGFEKYSWDTQLKIVHNLDLRFNLPAVYWPDLVPGCLLYFDLGYGSDYWGDRSGTPGVFLGSSGIGVYIDFFDIAYARLYLNVPLIGQRLDRAPLDIDFDLHLHF